MEKLFVIAGHGAGDPGACGNGYQEAERVRALAKRIKAFGGNNVLLGDLDRNYYADRGINSLNISKDYKIVELHMDSGVKSAKGGHVIIKDCFEPDKYDEALANMLKEILPGRSDMIKGRSDLANVNRAAAKGYNYRLVELGFISNAGDVKIFNSRMDDIAKGVLASFDIIPASTVTPAVTPKPSTSVKPTKKDELSVDGHWGPKTTKKLQQIFKTTVDGVVSNQWASYADENPGLDESTFDWDEKPNGKGSQLIKAMQKWAGMKESACDGEIGPKTIEAFQKKLGTKVDGCVSAPSSMVKALQKWANEQ